MKLFIATEARVYIVGDRYYASNPLCKVLERYHRFFGSIVLCTRFERKEHKNELSPMFEEATDYINEIVCIGTLNDVVVGKYDQEIENYEGMMSDMEDLELEVPEEIDASENMTIHTPAETTGAETTPKEDPVKKKTEE